MKRLLLWRHAKASPGDPRQEDADRELAPRGHEAARAIAEARAASLTAVSLVLCSTALRTRQTFEALQPHFATEPALRFEPGLYLADPLDLLERVARVEEDHASILMIGHNPGMEELVRLLVSEGSEEEIERYRAGFKTGALAELSLRIDHWREAGAGCATLDAFTRPRDLEVV